MAARLGMTSAHEAVLGFLNTIVRQGEKTVDLLATGEAVVRWLEQSGLAATPVATGMEPEELSREARLLRERVRELICRRRVGIAIEVSVLNEYLAGGNYRIELSGDDEGELRVVRRFSSDTPRQVLMAVAVAAADLLARGDFRVIRKCENVDCSLWFYDRTKSHRRRWCEMALCGNRHKVTQFRMRGNPE
ncbi:CGNR zinc finger domain-containing protein [Paraburkholderia oxyphila]|uniref:CGNR zinc finger domain-containing protein n=1 Tax=Paraburkholderia oxyphila TaxID=614212 RepID=UPI000488AC88|nr:ABATE domain-containing protein [Paraburkholderia oxyphila]